MNPEISNKADGLCFTANNTQNALFARIEGILPAPESAHAIRAAIDEATLYRELLNAGDKEKAATSKKQAAALAKAEKRKAEVDRLFMKLYEDWSSGRITEYNFTMLSEKYQDEQQALTAQIAQLKEALAADRQTTENTAKWMELIKRYVNPTALTAEMLNELIEKIVIHEATKGEGGQRTQKIEIYYRFVGKID